MSTTRGENESLAPIAYEPGASIDDGVLEPTETWWEKRSPRLGVVKAVGALAVGLTVASFTAVTILDRVEPGQGGPRLVAPRGDQAAVQDPSPSRAAALAPTVDAPVADVPVAAPEPEPIAPLAMRANAEAPRSSTPAAAPVVLARPEIAVVSLPMSEAAAPARPARAAPPPLPRRSRPVVPAPAPAAEVVAAPTESDFPYDSASEPPPAPAPEPGSSPYEPDSI